MATDTTTRNSDEDVEESGTAAGDTTSRATKSAARTAPLRRKPRKRSVSTTGVLATLLVVAAAFAGFFGYQYATTDSPATSTEASTAAIDVAKDYAIKLSSFDYRDLNKNRDAIAAMSTDDFAAKYSEMVTALSQIVTDGKGEATAEVSHAAVEKIDGSSATVILFVDQKARNVVSPDGKTQPYRMVVTLERSGARWLVDNVETK